MPILDLRFIVDNFDKPGNLREEHSRRLLMVVYKSQFYWKYGLVLVEVVNHEMPF